MLPTHSVDRSEAFSVDLSEAFSEEHSVVPSEADNAVPPSVAVADALPAAHVPLQLRCHAQLHR